MAATIMSVLFFCLIVILPARLPCKPQPKPQRRPFWRRPTNKPKSTLLPPMSKDPNFYKSKTKNKVNSIYIYILCLHFVYDYVTQNLACLCRDCFSETGSDDILIKHKTMTISSIIDIIQSFPEDDCNIHVKTLRVKRDLSEGGEGRGSGYVRRSSGCAKIRLYSNDYHPSW